MRIPTGLLTDTTTVTRRTQTGAGVIDQTVIEDTPCRITTRLQVSITPQGPVTLNVTTIYLPPGNPTVTAGDRFTLPDGRIVEARDISAPRVGTESTHTRVMAW